MEPMPWKVNRLMDSKIDFISRLGRGERMTDLCREFGIARKTGHKLKERYAARGIVGLEEYSRAPRSSPWKTPPETVELLLGARRAHPTWGPKKLKDVLERKHDCTLPSASTIGHILDGAGLVVKRRRRGSHKSLPVHLSEANAPNDLWCIDYKGQFRLGDQSFCYPLTITDQFSRFLLACEGMAAISDDEAREVCQDVFRRYGVPTAMRSDNGAPFASVGLAGLTRLAVYWLRLGIRLERTNPASPQDNGRHERMHRTLKAETTRPARRTLLQQQESFDAFINEYNVERPHEALHMMRPAEVYTPSTRPYPPVLPEPTYPMHDLDVLVRKNGFIRLPGRRGEVHVCAALRGQRVGLRELDDQRWLVSFMALDLVHVQPDNAVIPCYPDALNPNLLPMSPV